MIFPALLLLVAPAIHPADVHPAYPGRQGESCFAVTLTSEEWLERAEQALGSELIRSATPEQMKSHHFVDGMSLFPFDSPLPEDLAGTEWTLLTENGSALIQPKSLQGALVLDADESYHRIGEPRAGGEACVPAVKQHDLAFAIPDTPLKLVKRVAVRSSDQLHFTFQWKGKQFSFMRPSFATGGKKVLLFEGADGLMLAVVIWSAECKHAYTLYQVEGPIVRRIMDNAYGCEP